MKTLYKKLICGHPVPKILPLALIIFVWFNGPRLSGQPYNTTFTLSNGAQTHQISFDGLGFISGNFCACTFIPPGKVADYFGFQYLRDNDVTGMGHNSSFSGGIGNNVLHILDSAQKALLISVATSQINMIQEYAYMRFPLIEAFIRLRNEEIPTGSPGLDSTAVMAYSAQLYHLDATLSYQRAQTYATIINQLTPSQRNYLDSIAPLGEGNMPQFDTTQIDVVPLNNNQFVGVMSMADDIFSWYVGNINSDVYFCPERQGNYFGSFYMKDAPAMGVANYYIDTSRSQDGGVEFMSELDTSQLRLVTDLVDTQFNTLNAIVAQRTAISTLLRGYLNGTTVDTNQVVALSEIYGQLDGRISYYYATNFSKVNWTLTPVQMDSMIVFRNLPGYPYTGAYLYSDTIPMPQIENTDFLFLKSSETAVKEVTTNLYSCYPNPFTNRIQISNTTGEETYRLTNIMGECVWQGKDIDQYDFSGLSNGMYFLVLNTKDSSHLFKLIKL